MLSRTLPLILGVLLLLSPAQGGIQRKRRYEIKQGRIEIKECERKPKWYLCSRHCEAHRDCQANNVCCSTTCGNVCMNLLDNSVWEMPVTPPSGPYPGSGSPLSFEGDMVQLTFTMPSVSTVPSVSPSVSPVSPSASSVSSSVSPVPSVSPVSPSVSSVSSFTSVAKK